MSISVCFILFDKLSAKYGEKMESKMAKSQFSWNSRLGKIIKYSVALIVLGTIVGLLCYDLFGGDVVKTENLVGLGGLFAYILLSM